MNSEKTFADGLWAGCALMLLVGFLFWIGAGAWHARVQPSPGVYIEYARFPPEHERLIAREASAGLDPVMYGIEANGGWRLASETNRHGLRVLYREQWRKWADRIFVENPGGYPYVHLSGEDFFREIPDYEFHEQHAAAFVKWLAEYESHLACLELAVGSKPDPLPAWRALAQSWCQPEGRYDIPVRKIIFP